MSFFCYILFSPSKDKFYIGATSLSVEDRLERHLTKFYGNTKFTKIAKDWNISLSIECTSFKQAVSIEKHIKTMKSKTYIQNLIKYSEMRTKLLNRFNP